MVNEAVSHGTSVSVMLGGVCEATVLSSSGLTW